MPDKVENCYREHVAERDKIMAMKARHMVLASYSFEPSEIAQAGMDRRIISSSRPDRLPVSRSIRAPVSLLFAVFHR